MQIIFGNELFTINVAMQNSQDAAFYALWSAEMCAQHVVRVSAQIGYMNGSQPVIEQVLELPAPVFNPYSGSNHVPKLNSQTKILGEALNLASLLQQFIDNQSKLVWV